VVLLGVAAPPASADPGGAAAHGAQIAAAAVHPWRLGPDTTPLPFWPLRDPALRERAFGEMQTMGIHTARVDLRWYQVESKLKGLQDWSEFDAIRTSAQAHGVTLLPMVAMTPDWANGGRGIWSFPDNPQDFEDFMTAAIKRYPDIPAWEIWNEPNFSYFSKPAVDVDKFVGLLAAAHRAKLRAGSSAAIVSGGLATCGQDATRFFEDMVRLHAFDYVDGFAIHAYSPRPPTDARSFFLKLPHFHDRLVQIGRPGIGVWITEYGAPTSTKANVFGPAFGDEEQAARLRSAYAIAARWPWVRNLTWYELEDPCADPANVQCNFGLLRADFSQKPAYTALRGIVNGALSRIPSQISVGLGKPPKPARSTAKGKKRPAPRPVVLRGTVETAGLAGASVPITLTLSWSAKPSGPVKKTRKLALRASGGIFVATLPNLKAGSWRAVAAYRGSPDYEASSSAPVTVLVKR
jgi:polysaccharide biosynthesis protein PslG